MRKNNACQVLVSLLVTLGHLAIGTTNAFTSLTLRPMEEELDLSQWHLDLVGSIICLGAVVGCLAGSSLMHRFGRVNSIAGAALPYAAAWTVIGEYQG